MFKKLAAEAFGISDIGLIVAPQDYDKVDSDDFLFHEDGEKIYFLIKSKKDEYCFTNLALIHVDGDSAVSSKRRVKRYEYGVLRDPITIPPSMKISAPRTAPEKPSRSTRRATPPPTSTGWRSPPTARPSP